MFQEASLGSTPLNTLGEFSLIQKMTQRFSLIQSSSSLGIGDDAAVISPQNKEVVVTTDFLVEGVHFNLAYTPLKHLGYKSVVVNLSDIAAMNARPTQITFSLAVSNRFGLEAIDELFEGVRLACEHYQVDLVGGDTTSSLKGLVLSVTAIGLSDKASIVQRKGANPNDLLVVTGDLGAAYMGLQVLERENEVWKANPDIQPDLMGYDYILQRQLKPEACLDVIELLAKAGVVPTAMIDISDGLSSEVLHLAEHSGLGFRVYEDQLPMDNQTINAAEEFGINPVTAALNGGEDYELLMTISQNDFEKIKGNPHWTIIGYATQMGDASYLVTKGSEELVPLTAQGWNSFNAHD